MNKVLFWFRNDLRLHDNEAFIKATEKGIVYPVFIIDDRLFQKTSLGFKRTEEKRASFLLESIADLKKNLQEIGSDLIVKRGIPENLLYEIVLEHEITHVIASKEVTQEETSIESEFSYKLKPHNIDIELYWGNTLVHVRDLPFQIHFLPDVFTDFRKKVENYWKIRPLFEKPNNLIFPNDITLEEIPSLESLEFNKPDVEERDLNNFIGGESQALKRLNEYLWEKDLLKEYKDTRNGMLGKDYSSKMSSWLSLGCISPRQIYFEVKKYEKERIENESTYWLIFELLWRDYFHFIALKFGIRLFKRAGIKHDFSKKWKRNKDHFKKWKDGKTGVPIIDACMVELKQTGYISNRGRQLAASFLTKDLGIEWWWGAMYFESMLIDYEVCSNWRNWNYIAGIGTDPREDRYFNPIKQAEKYDPNADFIKTWLPQLKHLDKNDIINFKNLNLKINEFTDYPSSPLIYNKLW